DELQGYARRNGLVFLETDKGASQNVANERLQQLQEQLTKAQSERYEKEALYRLVQNGELGALPGVFENKLIQDLSERLAELKREHAQLSTTFSPDYPRVKEIQSQINEIESSLREERQRAADRIANDYSAAVRREDLIQQSLDGQQKQVSLIAEKSVQYNILKREVDTNKQLYEGLLQQLKEAGVSAGLKASNIRLVDSAEPPAKPFKPRTLLNLSVAVFLGLALGICAALFQERLDDTLKGDDDVERLVGLPSLALIPVVPASNGDHLGIHRFLPRDRSLSLAGNGNGSRKDPRPSWHLIDRDGTQHAALGEAFRSLRTSVLLSTPDRPPSSLLITSTQPGDGKTTVACNLAISLAQLGHRVLLVDADLRSPSLHKLFGIDRTLGLVSYLTGQQDWRAVVHPSGSRGLDLLVSGPVPPNPSELLSSQSMGALIRSASAEYGFVILDSSPMLALADSRILAPLVNGVLLVVRSGATPREQLLHAQAGIRGVGGNLIGVVLNSVDFRSNAGDYLWAWGCLPSLKTVFARHFLSRSRRHSSSLGRVGSTATLPASCFPGAHVRTTARRTALRVVFHHQHGALPNSFTSPAAGYLSDRLLPDIVPLPRSQREEAARLRPCVTRSVRSSLWPHSIPHRLAANFRLCQKILFGGSHRHVHQPQSFRWFFGNDLPLCHRSRFALDVPSI